MRVLGRNCLVETIPPMKSEFVAQVHHHPLQGVEHLGVSVFKLSLLRRQGADVLVLMLGIPGFAEDGDDPAESVEDAVVVLEIDGEDRIAHRDVGLEEIDDVVAHL